MDTPDRHLSFQAKVKLAKPEEEIPQARASPPYFMERLRECYGVLKKFEANQNYLLKYPNDISLKKQGQSEKYKMKPEDVENLDSLLLRISNHEWDKIKKEDIKKAQEFLLEFLRYLKNFDEKSYYTIDY